MKNAESYINPNINRVISITGDNKIDLVFADSLLIPLDKVSRIGSFISVSANSKGKDNHVEGIIIKGFGEIHFTGKLGPAGLIDACFQKNY